MDTTLIIIGIYLALIFIVAIYFSKKQSLKDYFLNDKSSGLGLMTFSTVSTLVGAGATVAIVSEVYETGISFGIGLICAFFFGALLLALLTPKIREYGQAHGIYTLADFFEVKFGKRNKLLVSILQVALMFLWISIQAYAFATLATILIGVNFYLALGVVSLITIGYTAIGGLKLDMISDVIQFFIIIIVFIIASIDSLISVGGLTNLFHQLPKEHLNPFNYGGVAWMIGAVLFGGFMYTAATHHWQRILSAKTTKIAKKSFYYSMPLLLIINLCVIIMGLTAAVLLTDINKDTAIFELMKTTLSPITYAVGMAAILAVLMSSIDSLLIGGSTIVYRSWFKKDTHSGKKQVRIAKVITLLFGIISFSVVLIFPDIVTLALFQSYFALIFVPPVLVGLYSKKKSDKAIFYSILIPFIVLLVGFTTIGKNIFIYNLLIGVSILWFYDKIN